MSNDKSTEEMIKDKNLTAPRVTPELIKSKIIKKEVIEFTTKRGSNVYIGLHEMENGFSVSGSPVVVESEHDDPIADTDDNLVVVEHKTLSGSILRFAYTECESGLICIGKPSASVSPKNDNREIGEKIAIENCISSRSLGYSINPIDYIDPDEAKDLALKKSHDEIWALEGYLLATELMKK